MADLDSSSNDPKDSVNFRKLRYFCDLLYAQNHPAVKEIRSGFLQRKTRFLKSYNNRFYVLTASGFLHQFKSDNLSSYQIPQLSLCLRDCEIRELSSADSQTYRFSLKGSKNGNSGRAHTFIFKANTYDDMINWYNDIKKFTGLLDMSENEFRDYIVALQVGNSVDGQATDALNDGSNEENKFSLVLKNDFKDDVDIMTSVSSAFYETKSFVQDGQVDDTANKEDINKECIANENDDLNKECIANENGDLNKECIASENGDLNKDSSSDRKNGIFVCLNGDVVSEQKKLEDTSADTSALLNASGTCANDSAEVRDEIFETSSNSSYSSTNEYACAMEIRSSSPDRNSDLGKSVVDTQKNFNQRDRSCSLHPVFESQANDDQGSCPLSSPGLSQLPSPAIAQSKFKEDLGKASLSNLDTADISDDKLDSEQAKSLENVGSVNGTDNISEAPSVKVLDGAELCSRKSLVELECQSPFVVSGLEVSEKSNHKELQESLQALDNNDCSAKELHKSDEDFPSKNV